MRCLYVKTLPYCVKKVVLQISNVVMTCLYTDLRVLYEKKWSYHVQMSC